MICLIPNYSIQYLQIFEDDTSFMIFSKAVEYGMKAMIYMAKKPEQTHFGVQELSHKLGVSNSYLAKILQSLSKEGYLYSATGPKGGFSFKVKPERIKTYESRPMSWQR